MGGDNFTRWVHHNIYFCFRIRAIRMQKWVFFLKIRPRCGTLSVVNSTCALRAQALLALRAGWIIHFHSTQCILRKRPLQLWRFLDFISTFERKRNHGNMMMMEIIPKLSVGDVAPLAQKAKSGFKLLLFERLHESLRQKHF